MGGGHVSRPDFGMPQPDPACPLTEFYLLLQHALDAAGSFALPALYARVQAPARWIDPDEAREYLTLSPTEREGDTRLLAPGNLQLLYSTLHVAPDGAPAALLLTGECTRTTVAVQLLPTPQRWAGSWYTRHSTSAGCITRRRIPFWPGGWRCCKGSTVGERRI